MQFSTQKSLRAESVLDELLRHFSAKGDSPQVEFLFGVGKLLRNASFHQSERCFPDAQAGAIATLIATKCVGCSDAALLVVTDDPEAKSETGPLFKTVAALQETGSLPPKFTAEAKRPASDYLCMKRFWTVSFREPVIPVKIWNTVFVDGLDSDIADKMRAVSCRQPCEHYKACPLQHAKGRFKSGSTQMQVYSMNQYRDALRREALPKSRVIVYTQATRDAILESFDCALYADTLTALAADCEKVRVNAPGKKKFVSQKVAIIRDSICGLCSGTATDRTAKRLMEAAKQAFADIQHKCAAELKIGKNKRIADGIHSALLQINRIMERGTYLTLHYGGKFDKIRIGIPKTQATLDENA